MPPRKGFLCVLELHIRAVTCPGVTLKAREDLYISACILGQHKKTSSVRAIFPLLFDEKLIFEKVYTDVVDPGDLVELFELDTAVLELIQTVPPVGEILATYEENTRDFLFPAPKLMCGQRGSVHEVLMKKTCGFTHQDVANKYTNNVSIACIKTFESDGIAPKLKFSTNCLISESLVHSKKAQKQDNLDWLHHASKDGTPQIRSSKKKTPSPERNRPCLATKTYEQPTIASLSRSPSPYTKRRMCELEQVRQRLAHLDLGPFDFRKESDRPPFVIRQAEPLPPSPDVHTWCRPRKNIKDAWSGTTCDPSLLGSYRPKNPKIIRSCYEKDFGGFSDSYDERLISSVAGRQFHPTRLLMHSAPPTLQKYYSTPMLNCFSLRERFRSGWTTPANGEEIHKRVKDILTTHSARQRLTFDESCLPKADSAKTRDSSKRGDSNKQEDVSCLYSFSNSELQSSSSIRQSNMVHLNNDDYWTSQAAEYKCKPHRAIFEDSLEKIYRNMYRKASESISKNK